LVSQVQSREVDNVHRLSPVRGVPQSSYLLQGTHTGARGVCTFGPFRWTCAGVRRIRLVSVRRRELPADLRLPAPAHRLGWSSPGRRHEKPRMGRAGNRENRYTPSLHPTVRPPVRSVDRIISRRRSGAIVLKHSPYGYVMSRMEAYRPLAVRRGSWFQWSTRHATERPNWSANALCPWLDCTECGQAGNHRSRCFDTRIDEDHR